jgi:hypothetical protein
MELQVTEKPLNMIFMAKKEEFPFLRDSKNESLLDFVL